MFNPPPAHGIPDSPIDEFAASARDELGRRVMCARISITITDQ